MSQTLKSLINNVRGYENWDEIAVSLIVSPGRTGTKYLSDLVNRLSVNIMSVHEPNTALHDEGLSHVQASKSDKRIVKSILEKRVGVRSQLKKQNLFKYLESNPQWIYLLPLAQHVFPDVKIILIQRNLVDGVRSTYSKFNVGNNNAFVFEEHETRRRVTPMDIQGHPLADCWKDMNRFTRICWMWSYHSDLLYSASQSLQNVHLVRYEELFDKEEVSTLKSLITELLSDDEEQPSDNRINDLLRVRANVNPKYLLPKDFDDWSSDQKSTFKSICSESMIRLGYQLPRE
jgi:hypothetical protein